MIKVLMAIAAIGVLTGCGDDAPTLEPETIAAAIQECHDNNLNARYFHNYGQEVTKVFCVPKTPLEVCELKLEGLEGDGQD